MTKTLKSKGQISDSLVFDGVFGRSDCENFQIVSDYRNWLKKLLKVLRQIATMK